MATGDPFDVEAFLSRPLTARLATNGPTIRPVWYLWEEDVFWIITGPWTRLPGQVRADPAVALVVDECDVATGSVRLVICQGSAELVPFDVPRGRRKLSRYLGTDETRWDPRFRRTLQVDPAETGTAWLRINPVALVAKDLSYTV